MLREKVNAQGHRRPVQPNLITQLKKNSQYFLVGEWKCPGSIAAVNHAPRICQACAAAEGS